MKSFSFLVLILLALVYCDGATLQWDPSPITTNAPPVAYYRVESSPVTTLTNATWALYGETGQTNLFITNNVYRMFRVYSVSATGMPSLVPSNVVTNNQVAPNPPGTAIITGCVEIEGTPDMQGPWLVLTNLNWEATVTMSGNQFIRARTTLAIAETPLFVP